MSEKPIEKLPREEKELYPFVELVRFMIDRLGLRVCVMSHENGLGKDGRLAAGHDHEIIDQLLALLKDQYGESQLFTLKGYYDALQTRQIIGGFDLLVSGRTHGAVQGLTQYIPTAIIDYGLGPKAHKLLGFARLVGIEEFLCDPRSSGSMIRSVAELWEKREYMRLHLARKIPEIQDQARSNVKLLREAIDVSTDWR
jgi:colanic acid/amylovoran biosynthesis protein